MGQLTLGKTSATSKGKSFRQRFLNLSHLPRMAPSLAFETKPSKICYLEVKMWKTLYLEV